jgi:hemerythrin superfamily protein
MKTELTIKTTSDVVDLIKRQHEQIKTLFAKVLGTRGEERQEAFYDLRRLLAIHETAEEEVVHPAAKKARGIGESVVAARLREEKEAKTVLAALEQMHVDAPAFETNLRALQNAVLAHATAEEQEELRFLAEELDEGRLQSMRKAVQFAESTAPTRPHPGIESRAANLLAGPFASLIDRARDAIGGKRDADSRVSSY